MSARRGRVPRLVWSITAVHALLLCAYSVLFVAFRAPDEPQHVDLVRAVRQSASYPRFDERYLSEQVVDATDIVRFDDRSKHLRWQQAPRRAARPPFDGLGDATATVPTERNQLPSHPPLYYGIAAGVATAVRIVVPGAADWAFDREVAMLRLLNVALAIPLPLLIYAVARRLRASTPTAIAASAFALAVPQLHHIGASVTNDVLLVLLCGVATLLVARVVDGDQRWSTALALGTVTGLALLTKAFAFVLLPWIAAAYLLRARSRGALGRAAAAGLVAFAIGGWWWLRNAVVFGSVQTGIKLLDPAPAGFEPDVWWWVRRFAWAMSNRFWGTFGWFDVGIPAAVTSVATLVLIGATMAGIAAGRRAGERGARAVMLVPVAGILGLVLMGSFQGYVRTGFDEGIQGRYLFAGLVGLAPVAALGLGRLAGRPRERWLPAGVLAAAGVMQLIAGVVIVSFYWGGASPVDRARAIVAWSPWPPVVLVTGAVALAAAAAIAAREAVRMGRRPVMAEVGTLRRSA